MVERQVEREPDPDHEAGELDRPPGLEREREHAGSQKRREHSREPRLQPASQRVRHACTLRRKRRAAYFAPMSVSAAGYAHCAGAPARASVRVASVSAGTVESGVSTIQPSAVSSSCSATSVGAAGRRNPRMNPVAQMIWLGAVHLGGDTEAPVAAGRSSGSSQPRPGG